MKTGLQVILLVLVSGLAAGIHGLIVGPEGSSIDLAASGLDLDQAMSLETVLWVDARPEEAYLEGHFADAIQINEDNWDEGISQLLEAWDPDVAIVVYCDGERCAASRELVMRIRTDLGLEPVYWLKEGYEAFQAMGGQSE